MIRRTSSRMCCILTRSMKEDIAALQTTLKVVEERKGVMSEAVACALSRKDCVLITGVGKSGKVGERLSVSLRSLGVRSSYIHASEWVHGDLGELTTEPFIIALSHSGKTAEVIQAVAAIRTRQPDAKIALVTQNPESPVCPEYSLLYSMGPAEEPLGSVPTTTVVLQEAICNCIVRQVAQTQGMTPSDFKKNHPGGAIGAKLA
eukprot:TRINITY_DN38198_c0_g1_i1.p1 TRINITY_DN38198_c0_g1~~TRINITY_DN38198_c0_g1_i1.p1  ORF type:complete len:204 (+),score=26.04 TRINITY_DN38198_c0_g1_i1:113-724(+)